MLNNPQKTDSVHLDVMFSVGETFPQSCDFFSHPALILNDIMKMLIYTLV